MLTSLAGVVKRTSLSTVGSSATRLRCLSMAADMNSRFDLSAAGLKSAMPSTDEFEIFPNEAEGNIYADNWSLCDDGLYSQGKAYRNARLAILTKELGAKKGEPIKIEKLNYYGKYTMEEAGDSISQNDFKRVLEAQQDTLCSGADIYMEDASLGSHSKSRLGVRVVTLNPAVALIARTLMVPIAPRPCDHRSRFNGWNLDPRWQKTSLEWNGTKYDTIHPEEQAPAPGQRPIAAFVGGAGSKVLVQFKGTDNIVGATVVVGEDAPMEALVSGLGHAASTMMNSEYPDSVAVPSVSFTGKSGSVVVVGVDQAVLDGVIAASKTLALHGAYHNLIAPEGVSALWGGVIAQANTPLKAVSSEFGILSSPLPTIIGTSGAAMTVGPDNLIAPPKVIAFYEEGAAKSALTPEQAVKKLAEMTDAGEDKLAAITALLKGVQCSVVGKVADVTIL